MTPQYSNHWLETKIRMKISADDSVLQMVTRSSRKLLEEFVKNPSPKTVSPLVVIPAIYRVLLFDSDHHAKPYSASLVAICKWIVDRAKMVLESLVVDAAPGMDITAMSPSNDWRKVCLMYFVNQDIRFHLSCRPVHAIACHRSVTGPSTPN